MLGGFGVGFGVGEFGSGGYALEVHNSAVTMVSGAEISANPTEITSETALAQMTATSSLLVDPAGITLSKGQRTSPKLRTAKPVAVQELRAAPVTTPSTTYTIQRRRFDVEE